MGIVATISQPSFAAGELSPAVQGRTDLAKYRAGAALLRNFFVQAYGGAATRAGSAIVGRCKQPYGTRPRDIDFIYGQLQAYALEFGELYMRVIMNGGYVLEPTLAITAATAANPTVFTHVAHGLLAGDWLFAAGFTTAGWIGFNSTAGFLFKVATVPTVDTFTCTDLDGNAISSLGFGAYPGGATVARIFTLTTPYAAADLPLLKYVQSADVMTLTHPSYAARNLTRSSHYAWTLSTITFAALVQVPTALAAVGSGALTLDFYYVVTAETDSPPEESLPTAAAVCSGVALNQQTGLNNALTWAAPATGPTPARYKIYGSRPVAHGAPAPTVFGYIGQTTSLAFNDTNIAPDFSQSPPTHRDPFAGANYPAVSNYFQGRQGFAAPTAFPLTAYLSQSANFKNMDVHIPVLPDDAITITLVSRQVNAIKALIAVNALIALTSSGAWMISGGSQSDVITPSTIVATPQAYNGICDVPPLPINYDILYVQARGSKVRDLAYNFYVNLYTGNDVSVLSNHLFFGYQILEWCYAEEPWYQIQAVRDDGQMLVFAYLKEQDVYAWSHYDTFGQYQSVCAIPEGAENAVYQVVARTVPGVNAGNPVYYQERQASRNFYLGGFADVSLAWCLDSAVRYGPTPRAGNLFPGANAKTRGSVGVNFRSDAGVFTVGMVGNVIKGNTGLATITGYVNANNVTCTIDRVFQTIPNDPLNTPKAIGPGSNVMPMSGWFCTAPISVMTGLEHLNGLTVALLVDGGVQASQVVVNGQVTLQQPGTIVLAGLPYTCQMQTLRLDVGQPSIQGKYKLIPSCTLIVQDTRGLKMATVKDNGTYSPLAEFKERGAQPWGSPIELHSGIERLLLSASWQKEGAVLIQQDNPLPATILACVPNVVVGDDPG